MCTWYQTTLGRRSLIDFVIVSHDLRLCVLDTRVKTGRADQLITICWWVVGRGGHWTDLVSSNELHRWIGNIWGRPLPKSSSTPTSSRVFLASQWRLGALNQTGQCPTASISAAENYGFKDPGWLKGKYPLNTKGGHRRTGKPSDWRRSPSGIWCS